MHSKCQQVSLLRLVQDSSVCSGFSKDGRSVRCVKQARILLQDHFMNFLHVFCDAIKALCEAQCCSLLEMSSHVCRSIHLIACELVLYAQMMSVCCVLGNSKSYLLPSSTSGLRCGLVQIF